MPCDHQDITPDVLSRMTDEDLKSLCDLCLVRPHDKACGCPSINREHMLDVLGVD